MRFKIMAGVVAGAAAMMLAACSESNAGGADRAAQGKAGQSYELVIATRPVSVEKETAIARAAYQMCAAAAKASGVAVKPLVTLPKDYVMIRTTYRSDGHRFFEQEELYTLASHLATPQNGCATQIAYSSSTTVGSPERSRYIGVSAEGEREVRDNEPQPAAGPDQGAAEIYSVAKQIGGRAYKCMAPGSPGFLPSMKEMCILDTKGAILSNIDGRAIVAYARKKVRWQTPSW
ncbi:hypothetical protein [Duganella sp. P38]|uniref:hypothetical protein n=1 Tax=Duganella sp. P38 TaxID=3423949 RepID=UPI003D7B5603